MTKVLQEYCFCILLLILSGTALEAQTCCSAGAPLVSTNGITSNGAKQLGLHLDYNYTSINRLVSENRTLQNDPRTRNVNTILLRTDYSISDRWAVGLTIPYRNQNRSTISEDQSSTGLGDIIILGQYTIPDVFKGNQLQIATGLKLPTGVTDNLGSRNIFLSPDMQTGTGTYDFISSLSLIRKRIFESNFNAQTGILYRTNTTNQNFGSSNGVGGREFKFGNELQLDFSLNYEFLVGSTFLVPDINFTYRTTAPNQEQNFKASNSGGNWLTSKIGLFVLPNEKFSQRIYAGIPLAQDLEGLQITTNFEVGLELTYRFKTSKSKVKKLVPTPLPIPL